jgi:hypothetical protein
MTSAIYILPLSMTLYTHVFERSGPGKMQDELGSACRRYQQLALDVGDIPGHQVRRILVRQVSEYKRRHDCL